MRISPRGLDLIRRHEGCRLQAYRCPAGILTIGIGHTGPEVTAAMEIDEEEALALLASDVGAAEDAVMDHVQVRLNQNEFDALVSFTFNVGPGAFAKSTLLRLLNAEERYAASLQFDRWTRAGTTVLPGLVARRAEERSLFLEQP